MEIETVRNHLSRVAQLTHDNDHTGALTHLATVCGYKQMVECLKGVRAIQNAEHETPDELITYRLRLQDRLLAYIAAYDRELAYAARRSL